MGKLTTLALGLLAAPLLLGARGGAPAPKPGLELAWADVHGNGYGTPQVRGAAATVFVFVSTECPMASQYATRLGALEREYFDRRVRVFLVDAHPTDNSEKLREWAKARGVTVPLVLDRGGVLAGKLGAARTPEAVVVGRDGGVVYRGRIDDSSDSARVRKRYLREALDATLAGRPIAASRVPLTDGCQILKAASVRSTGVDYARHVAPILNRSCVSCHRTGEVAPFSLDSYAQARLWAPMLAEVAERRVMPPWKAAAGYGEFHGARALTDGEISTLAAWAKGGAPSGDLKTAPPPPPSAGPWAIGNPDLVLRPDATYALEAEGRDEYRCFVLPAEFTADTFVQAVQVKPGNTAVVHHIIVYVVPDGQKALDADAADPAPGFVNPVAGTGPPIPNAPMLIGWAPGSEARPLPDGIAHRIPRGARLVMEIHYHRSGKPETDRTEVGLTFSRETVQKEFHIWSVAPLGLNLPAGVAKIPVSAALVVPADLTVYAVSPHMHQIGTDMHLWEERADGAKQELVWVKNWDFQWQATYSYRTPVKVKRGAKIQLRATFDNSALNPRNPNRPPKTIHWGEASTDEMCIGFFSGTQDSQQLNIAPAPWRETVKIVP